MNRIKIYKVIILVLIVITALTSLIIGSILKANDKQLENISKVLQPSETMLILFFSIFFILVSIAAIYALYEEKIYILHLYWIICLCFMIVFLGTLTTTYNIMGNQCQKPKNYFILKLKQTSQLANSTFCLKQCPCTKDSIVQDCLIWNEKTYSPILQYLENTYQCSGWCQQNSMYNFIRNGTLQKPKGCYNELRNQLQNSKRLSETTLGLCGILLLLIILIINWLIFVINIKDQENTPNNQKDPKDSQRQLQQQIHNQDTNPYIDETKKVTKKGQINIKQQQAKTQISE